MYTMKEVCERSGLSYETLKYYCNEGLVPNLNRNKQNHRVFDDANLRWVIGLRCLRDCAMSIKDMRHYVALCVDGNHTIQERKQLLEATRKALYEDFKRIEDSLEFIENKMTYYSDLENRIRNK